MTPLTRQAPAKINLTLRVLRKREDGFHEIDSLMVKLPGLSDLLEIDSADRFEFRCDDSSLNTDESNLVVKAARAFESAAGISLRLSIHLQKRIPHGAGLGGGSSDAASTLLALNDLHGAPLDSSQLHGLAASLGSDVPFFLHAEAARASGRGEILEAVDSPPSLPVLLLKPQFGVATPDAYRRWSGSKPLAGIRYEPQPVDGLSLVNDLELPVFAKHRFLGEIKSWLLERSECRAALLCGSGSTVFAVLHEGVDATELARCARHELDPGLWHWSGKTAGDR